MRIKYLLLLLLHLTIIFSCRREETDKEKPVAIDTLPAPDTTPEQQKEIIIHPDSSFRTKVFLLEEKLGMNAERNKNIPSILPDRFESEWKYSYSFSGVDSSDSGIITFYFYEYKDSSGVANVLSNWYSCFGKKCEVIKENVDAKISEGNASYTLVTQNYFIHASIEKPDPAEWRKEIKKIFQDKVRVEWMVKVNGNLSWY